MSWVVPVRYYGGPNNVDGGYCYTFWVRRPMSAHDLNQRTSPGLAWWKYGAGDGIYCFRDDCWRDAREFERRYGVCCRVMCFPIPVKWYAYPGRYWETFWKVECKRALLHYMLLKKLWCSEDVANIVLAFLLGSAKSQQNYRSWLPSTLTA